MWPCSDRAASDACATPSAGTGSSEPGVFDWAATDEVLGHLHDTGMVAIVDLVHHTSYPRWLDGGFADPRFAPSYLRYVEAFAERYPWIEGYCWFPFVDSSDWDSLLARCTGSIDPVGVFWLDDELSRRASSMSLAYRSAAGGTPAAELPAYRFQPPVDQWLAGWLPQMAHWDWREPPVEEQVHPPPSTERIELRIVEKGP